jgi:hypothetical protein
MLRRFVGGRTPHARTEPDDLDWSGHDKAPMQSVE